ncbi:SpaA isopeptide-forming pilin-related protein [Microbacterium sp. NPDC076768]|uniref:DUF7927 domain-containing protein n=1 Tax=Microbacterium sp. NPDC076768 TaxID=3154858 RepID=UPI0034190E9E
MEINPFTRSERMRRPERRFGSRLAACTLAVGLSIAVLGTPVTASAETVADDTAPVIATPAPDVPVTDESAPDTDAPEASDVESTSPQDDASASATDDAEPESSITPRSIPVPPAGSAVITVKVGGDRLPDGTVQGLAGVQLALHAAGTATTGGGFRNGAAERTPDQGNAGSRYSAAWSWTTCVSDADGDCNFVIPIRSGGISSTGVPQDTRFWVVEEASPEGWYSNPQLRVGKYSESPETAWEYRFRTDTQLRAGVTYSSTAAMPWNDPNDRGIGSGDPDRYFMRNRLDNNSEGWYAANVTRTTGVWSQSRANPVFPASCTLDVALLADTSNSLGTSGMAELKSAMSSFVDAFRGTPTRMGLFSFSDSSPGRNASNSPTLLPVTTAEEGNSFKAQYADWEDGGGTNWDAGFATAATAAPHYDVAVLLTDGNPSVIRDNEGSSAYNSLQDVDAGIFSANQLKAEGTRVIALGVGPSFTSVGEFNLRAVSGPTLNSDYYRASSFAAAADTLADLANTNCQGSIGVQKMIVPNDGTIEDATPAPAGWQFDATSTATAAVNVNAPSSQLTTEDSDGKVDFGLTFPGAADSGGVQILETQQDGYEIVPVGTGASARNAVCVNSETGTSVTVTDAGTAAQPGFTVSGLKNQRVECTIYNREPTPGAIEVEKSSDPASGAEVTPGQSVTYTLTFRNTGGLPVTVDHEDVLSDVLDDADLQGAINAEAPLAAVLNGDRIRVTGELAANTTRTVTYSVTVKDPLLDTSNAMLGNFVVPTGEEPPETCDPETPCTEHPVRVSLAWNKVNLEGDRLSGSEWLLTPYTASGELDPTNAIIVVDCITADADDCTGADRDPEAGEFLLVGITPGTYELSETTAPAGYMLLEQTIDIALNTNVSYGDIENDQIQIPGIPLTGGMGTLMFFLGAGGLGGLAALGIWRQRRQLKAKKL